LPDRDTKTLGFDRVTARASGRPVAGLIRSKNTKHATRDVARPTKRCLNASTRRSLKAVPRVHGDYSWCPASRLPPGPAQNA